METINVWLLRARLNRDPGVDFERIFSEKMARGGELQSKLADNMISLSEKKTEYKKIKKCQKVK